MKNSYYPTVIASLLALVVVLHTVFMANAILPIKSAYIDRYISDLSLLVWHILIAVSYIVALIYAYKKRAILSKKRINFIIYLGFLLYFFLSFSACTININIAHI